MTNVKTIALTSDDIPAVAKIHVKAFPTSAVTKLGEEAVRRYYEWQFIGPHQAFYVGATVNKDLAGFCIYGRFNSALGGYLAKNKAHLISKLLLKPWLLFEEEIANASMIAIRVLARRLLNARHRTRPAGEVANRDFGILSIAVSPDYRRLGIGSVLMENCERRAHELGVELLELTVHPSNAGAIRFYENLGWFRAPHKGRWTGIMNKHISR